jgi:hypothetical protein
VERIADECVGENRHGGVEPPSGIFFDDDVHFFII